MSSCCGAACAIWLFRINLEDGEGGKMEITDELIQKEIEKIPDLYGTEEFGSMIGWYRQKIYTYNQRGLMPKPATLIGGKRPVWTLNQIKKFAKENNLEIKY